MLRGRQRTIRNGMLCKIVNSIYLTVWSLPLRRPDCLPVCPTLDQQLADSPVKTKASLHSSRRTSTHCVFLPTPSIDNKEKKTPTEDAASIATPPIDNKEKKSLASSTGAEGAGSIPPLTDSKTTQEATTPSWQVQCIQSHTKIQKWLGSRHSRRVVRIIAGWMYAATCHCARSGPEKPISVKEKETWAEGLNKHIGWVSQHLPELNEEEEQDAASIQKLNGKIASASEQEQPC